jgi:hypothetical protein
MNIMNVVQHNGILHNDLSKDNIDMLHFSPDNIDVMYIGMCDWGEMGCLQEATPLLYGFPKEQDAINMRKMHWWVALQLFFVHDKLGTINSP